MQSYDNLYCSLSYNIPTDDLTLEEKQELADLVKILDHEKKEIIYLLTLYDYTKHHPGTKVIFPYKIKQTSSDRLELKVDCLPIRLKRILHKFVKLAESSTNKDE